MLEIKRDEEGKHSVDGKPFNPLLKAGVFRKTALARALQMEEAFSVETLEGTMEGKAGDWLMIGVSGEMYPCDAEIFSKSYEIVVREG